MQFVFSDVLHNHFHIYICLKQLYHRKISVHSTIKHTKIDTIAKNYVVTHYVNFKKSRKVF